MNRLKKEIESINNSRLPGITLHPSNTNIFIWTASTSTIFSLTLAIDGPEDSPYEGGVFSLTINVPDRYPFEPPVVTFDTPIYHCNIDQKGRICLDLLKMPPTGSWKPSINLSTLMISLQVLMGDPNPDDPLIVEIANEFKNNKALYLRKAKDLTEKHAMNTDDDAFSVNLEASPTRILKDEVKENTKRDGEETAAAQPKKPRLSFKLKPA